MKRFFNPMGIIGCWIFIVFIFDLVTIPYAYYNTVGGEQKPIIYLMSSFRTAFIGVFILSFLTSILFFDWFKRYWFINCFFFLLAGIYLYIDFGSSKKIGYGFVEKSDSVAGYEIRTKVEYYDQQKNKVRSVSFWRNEQKDSVWTVYSEDGSVLKREYYKNDSLTKSYGTFR